MIWSSRHVACLRGALPRRGRSAQPADCGPDEHDETDDEPEAEEPAEAADDHHEWSTTAVHHLHHGWILLFSSPNVRATGRSGSSRSPPRLAAMCWDRRRTRTR